ncbi:MAG: DUF2804 family protein [Polyangiaceae bacterium]
MRVFEPVVDAVVESDGTWRFGSYRGRIRDLTLPTKGRSAFARLVQRKHWHYFGFASPDAFVSVAVVKAGYFSTAFVHAFRSGPSKVARHAVAVASTGAAVMEGHTGPGSRVTFAGGGGRVSFVREPGSAETTIAATFGDLRLEGVAVETDVLPPVTAVARVGDARDDRVDVTEKHAALRGRFTFSEGTTTLVSADDARVGRDMTVGYLPRRTRWTWCLAMGTTDRGDAFGMNLVQGFVGEGECALWVGDELVALEEGMFDADAEDAGADVPFRIRSRDGAVDLAFAPFGSHREARNLAVLRSDFLQRAGTVSGAFTLPSGRMVEVREGTAIVERQDTTW